MRLRNREEIELHNHIEDIFNHEEAQKMKSFMQHGSTDTFEHSYMVAYYSYWLCQKLKLKFDMRSVARGAMLHDFYLYDWHVPDESHRLHGFFHPGKALKNAEEHFDIGYREKDIIETHMWPLTLTKVPKTREAIVVCLVDKLCSIVETVGFRKLNTVASR